MLVLSRHIDQSIRIDLSNLIPLIDSDPARLAALLASPVDVVVTAFHGRQVRLGINAPREIPVHRCEVYAAIESGKRNAMKSV